MKVEIKFDLPEDVEEYRQHVRCGDVELALWEFSGNLRQYWKYGHQFKNADEAIEKIREELYDCFESVNDGNLLT